MTDHPWFEEFPGAITVCDANGIIIDMNAAAAHSFQEDGGRALIGTNLLDCHPESARSKLHHLLTTHVANVYTIERNGVKNLIYQTPWYQDGEFSGMVEMSLEIPYQLPNFIRDSA